MPMRRHDFPPAGMVEVITPYITKNGKRIYKKDGGYFRFFAPDLGRRQ